MKDKLIVFVTFLFIYSLTFNDIENVDIKEEINETETIVENVFEKAVTLTTYNAVAAQTDSTPNLTASGFEIDLDNPKKHRIIAVSRDLKRELKWGEKVVLENAGRFNGVWYVRDLMNPRFRNKIDVLINEGDRHTKLFGVIVKKLD